MNESERDAWTPFLWILCRFPQLWVIQNGVVNHGESQHRGEELDDSSK
jgi:hypothetical protein